MKNLKRLKSRFPYAEYHHITCFLYEGRYSLKNIRYIIEGYWHYPDEHFFYISLRYIGDKGKLASTGYKLLDQINTDGQGYIFESDNNLYYTYDNVFDKIEMLANEDFRKRNNLADGEILYDQTFLYENIEKADIYDKQNLWKNFSGMDWQIFLSKYPKFSDRCDNVNGWSLIDNSSWDTLLSEQAQFVSKFEIYMNRTNF